MKVNYFLLMLILFINCNFYNAKSQTNDECEVSWPKLQVFLNDTSNRKLLVDLDSQLFKCFLHDSMNERVLRKIKLTRAHLKDFYFLQYRIYPKLYKDKWQLNYELSKICEFRDDTAQLCLLLIETEKLLKDIDYNDISNIDILIPYIDVIYQLHGESFANNFILTKLSNDEILNHPNYISHALKTIMKWHKKPCNCYVTNEK